jgi:hypothetical protein
MKKRKYDNSELLNYVEKTPNADSFENLEILLHLDSYCLGDTICFSSYLKHFLEIHKPKKLIISTFFSELFESWDEKVFFLNSNQFKKIEIDKLVSVGYNKKDLNHTLNGMFYATKDTMSIPQHIKPAKPPVIKLDRNVISNKVTIGPESIKKIARWDYKDGWQSIVDYLNKKNFIVYNVSYEKNINLKNVYNLNNFSLNVALNHILQSRMFIGLSSGLSWLAWAYDVPVVMISNFTKKHNEFDCFRVDNQFVCSGCFNTFTDIRSNCPIFLNTPRENECHYKITPDMVIEKIEEALKS